MSTGRSSFRTSGMTTALIGGVRAVDWWLPMGIAVPMLYVVPVLASSCIPRSRTILLTVAIDGAPSSLPAWIVRCNRFFAGVVRSEEHTSELQSQ